MSSTSIVDPVTVEIVRNAFSAIAAEMNANLARSAFSPVIYEMKDCSVAIFNRRAELLGQSPGLPIFLGALDEALRVTVEHVGIDRFEPGDIYILNDSYLTGSHLNDVVVQSPIFYRGELVGFTSSKAHWRDIGGKDAGLITDSTEIFQEGLRLGPTRLVAAGRPCADLLDILLRNSRLPLALQGDLNAQIAGARTGEQRLCELLARFGVDTVQQATRQIFEQTERLEREIIASLRDGEYAAEGFLDNDGVGADPVPVKVRVLVEGDTVLVDLTGSSPQTSGSLNCGRAQTLSAARLAYKFFVRPHEQPNGGSFRSLRVTIPPRSIFAAEEPAACLYYFPHLGLMIDLILTALAPVMPERVVSGQTADPMNVFLGGWHPQTRRRFMTGEATAIGWGAAAHQDGENAIINYGGGDLKNLPVEVLEGKYPIRVERYALNVDSGGPGRQRGGLGVIKEYVPLSEGIALSLWFERSRMPAWGLFGGESGKAPVVILDGDSVETRHAWKVNHLPVRPGTRISARTGGGGGFGPAWERAIHAVVEDVRNGYVSRQSAMENYGLRFRDDTLEVDERATQEARAALKEASEQRTSMSDSRRFERENLQS